MACGLGSGSVSLGRQHLSRPCSRGATWARSRAVHRRAALFGTLFIMLTCTLSSANTTLCRRRSRVVTPDIIAGLLLQGRLGCSHPCVSASALPLACQAPCTHLSRSWFSLPRAGHGELARLRYGAFQQTYVAVPCYFTSFSVSVMFYNFPGRDFVWFW